MSHDDREYDDDLLIIEEEPVSGPYRDGRPIL
jgi:hypothetical protein